MRGRITCNVVDVVFSMKRIMIRMSFTSLYRRMFTRSWSVEGNYMKLYDLLVLLCGRGIVLVS